MFRLQMFRRACAAFIAVCFCVQNAHAAGQPNTVLLPQAAAIELLPAVSDVLLKGIKIDPKSPLRLDFIIANDPAVKPDTKIVQRLVKYFLAGLTIPERDIWVNLSPYEKDRIIPDSFGQTELGRDVLAEDYVLKQVTAGLMHPDGETGKTFWRDVYAQAAKQGITHVPVNAFNKVWIVPETADVYEHAQAGTAYVVKARLKVMLDQDYTAKNSNSDRTVSASQDQIASELIRKIILPVLTREVNEGKHFTRLRQVYHSLILAAWYKKRVKESIINSMYVNRSKVGGITYADTLNAQGIYNQYVAAFKKGAANIIREETDPVSGHVVPRKYFTGGMQVFPDRAMNVITEWKPNTGAGVSLSQVRVDLDSKETSPEDPLAAAIRSISAESNLLKQSSALEKIFSEDNQGWLHLLRKMQKERHGRLIQVRKKILTDWGRQAQFKGEKLYYPFGGMDVFTAFGLNPAFRDVFVMGSQQAGKLEDIVTGVHHISANPHSLDEYGRNADLKDDLWRFARRAMAQVLLDMQGDLKGLYYFDISEKGGIEFIDAQDVRAGRNIMMEFDVKDEAGNTVRKRFWYAQNEIKPVLISDHNDQNYAAFIARFKFDAMLLKASMDLFERGDTEIDRSYLDHITLKRVGDLNARILTDKRYGNPHRPLRIWARMPEVISITMMPFTHFGYSTEEIYAGWGKDLIADRSYKGLTGFLKSQSNLIPHIHKSLINFLDDATTPLFVMVGAGNGEAAWPLTDDKTRNVIAVDRFADEHSELAQEFMRGQLRAQRYVKDAHSVIVKAETNPFLTHIPDKRLSGLIFFYPDSQAMGEMMNGFKNGSLTEKLASSGQIIVLTDRQYSMPLGFREDTSGALLGVPLTEIGKGARWHVYIFDMGEKEFDVRAVNQEFLEKSTIVGRINVGRNRVFYARGPQGERFLIKTRVTNKSFSDIINRSKSPKSGEMRQFIWLNQLVNGAGQLSVDLEEAYARLVSAFPDEQKYIIEAIIKSDPREGDTYEHISAELARSMNMNAGATVHWPHTWQVKDTLGHTIHFSDGLVMQDVRDFMSKPHAGNKGLEEAAAFFLLTRVFDHFPVGSHNGIIDSQGRLRFYDFELEDEQDMAKILKRMIISGKNFDLKVFEAALANALSPEWLEEQFKAMDAPKHMKDLLKIYQNEVRTQLAGELRAVVRQWDNRDPHKLFTVEDGAVMEIFRGTINILNTGQDNAAISNAETKGGVDLANISVNVQADGGEFLGVEVSKASHVLNGYHPIIRFITPIANLQQFLHQPGI